MFVFDVAIIGGGINGCGCAADAALRGLSVFLCDKGDLASQTSSKSSQLIHGGLRYLETYEFSYVRKALNEREKLLRIAPHLIHPLPFVLPYQKSGRPLWMIRAGLFLYDYLSQANTLPHTKFIKRAKNSNYFKPLISSLNKGFLYYDGATDDARLTLANALQAKQYGATIMPQTKLIKAAVHEGLWCLTLEKTNGKHLEIKAKALINASGPWVTTINQLVDIPNIQPMSLVKGSHIIVPKLYEGEHAYVLQHTDKRIVFTIPYHGFSLIGTTDMAYTGDPNQPTIELSEITYLCDLVKTYFKHPLDPSSIIASWSGIRPLLSDGNKTPSTLSRDYKYHFSSQPAPSVSIYGGKITTYRQLSEQVINELRVVFPNLKPSSTATTPLPGSALGELSLDEYVETINKNYPWLDSLTKDRHIKTYGTRTDKILSGRKNMADLGKCFMPTLYQAEVDYLKEEEWVETSDDVLWRRTKLGLTITDAQKQSLIDYMMQTLIKLPF